MKIFWTKESKENLLSIGRFISIDNSQAAARTISNIRKRVLPLKDKAFLGRIVPETGDKSITGAAFVFTGTPTASHAAATDMAC